MAKRIAIVLSTFDGIISQTCGIGTISKSFVESYKQIKKKIEKTYSLESDFYVIHPMLNSEFPGFDSTLKQNMEIALKKMGGKILYALNGSSGDMQYGGYSNWIQQSTSCASLLVNLSKQYVHVINFSTDTPFLGVGNALANTDIVNIINIVYLHSDSYIHEKENQTKERQSWENSTLKTIPLNTYIADVNTFFTNHLKHHYGVDHKYMLPVRNGLNFTSERYKKISQRTIKDYLVKKGIPTDKKLIFSVGRAAKYKGFKELINGFINLNQNDTHLVILASEFQPGYDEVNYIKSLVTGKNNISGFYSVDFEMPRYLAQRNKSIICAQLSSAEPFGLMPEEIRIWSNSRGAIPLTTKCEGYMEQIDDGVDGFFVDDVDPQTISLKLKQVINYEKYKIDSIRESGYKRLLRDYDYPYNLTQTFDFIFQNILTFT